MVVDLGTGNSRIAIVSGEGSILSLVRENSVVHTDKKHDQGQYFLPNEWAEKILRMAREALSKAGNVTVTAVTATSQRQGIVLIGHDGAPVIGFPNADRRSRPFLEEFDWDRIWELTSLRPAPILSAMKVVGTMRFEPELLEKTAFYTSISDWVGHLFTGVGVWERAQAMQSALYDPLAGDWSGELCSIFGIDCSKLPPLANAGSILGPVKPEIRRALGLGEGAVFVVGTADTQAAITGTGVEEGETIIVSGTTSPCIKVMPQFRKFPLCWVSPTAELGQFMLEVNTASSGVNLQRFRDQILPGLTYDDMREDALRRGLPQTGLPGCLAIFLTGMHLDKDMLDGGFVLRNPVSVDLKPIDFLQALQLNIGMSIALCLQRLQTLDGFARDYLIGCGGGFVSPVVGQTAANLAGMPIRVYENFREASVFGCYALCMRALNRPIPPRKLQREIIPRHSDELAAYYEQWKACRERFREFEF